MSYKPVVLVILDGVGIPQRESVGHPFAEAHLPTFHELEQFYPFTTLSASGVAVGLPWGEEGNSEVGHFTMGAGRVVYNHLPRIITAIRDGSFFENKALKDAAEHVKKNNSTLHLMGLFSSGSVHAYMDHVYALLEFAKRGGIEHVVVHPFTDGRDAPPDEGRQDIVELARIMRESYPNAILGSIMGRSFAMNRSGHWSQTERAYNLLTEGTGAPFSDADAHIEESYKKGISDEFMEPCFYAKEGGVFSGRIKEGDAVVYWDFREDSARQLTQAFVLDDFSHFQRKYVQNLFFVTMTEYDKSYPVAVAFPPLEVNWPLARVISEAARTQLHVAESDKYAHVTYFFNGGREDAFSGEERRLIPSPPSSDLKTHPEMAASRVTDAILTGISTYDFILANYANGDMVGHTGDFDATVKALEALDTELGRLKEAVLEAGGVLLITADHGNAEEKRYRESAEPRTKHTTNPVPFFLIARDCRRGEPRTEQEIKKQYRTEGGVLADVAPTILEYMELEKPGEMIGISLGDSLISRSSS
ncbi:MAG: phosphoglycerate mutase (2,3-diphosphoglycerate-independent) [Candidatus Ryanbacteria bacterium RIFCSPHIGHO2_02_FULL_45_17b]|uniref:2,3-bisphosphoglycerate-independent phosphoglycerate mutase n=1 Tax=Candidatus Ryanbacteria bacterium RIFCSPHIGHO2_01_FULL_45_22 TaxID=1802114 RepID=A0A1G2G1T9_9BACT|nr:MAG: phosphoglycerate mutase (2,3-diphosphoglycerate-independent) [Candidatus Ryanbacteria bacterium RIFCSPHIGHO2_01_FULL_45_22]OGZ47825.1 MAG: phosphoglycerate mutase (2,3-diphosphoglycerate-independent) [Candidatus Ryanbacteria bacterium RIFCSPHIGHO2_02_FULL_45_17b]